MTVIRPNSISGVSSITGSGGDISIFRADGTPADVTVNNITSGIVTATTFVGNLTGNPTGSGANLTSLPAANLTGTIADARFPATLPTASGANLTNLPAGNLTGIVTSARLGGGTASSSTFLRGDGTFAEAGGGIILQTVNATVSSQVERTSSGYADTGLTANTVSYTHLTLPTIMPV